jgi:hypothetical protein
MIMVTAIAFFWSFTRNPAIHGGFGSETAKNLTAKHLTDIAQRTQLPVRM